MTRDPFDLSGRTALVTGANRGLGRAFALALAQAGAAGVVVGRHGALSRDAAQDIGERTGRRTTVLTGDVAQPEDVARIAGGAIAAHGRVDVLGNNGGICFHRPALEGAREEYDAVF